MDRWIGKTAVVTGASAGIGRAIAKLLAENGLTVVAVARREERLKELAASISNSKGGKIVPFTADITKEDQAVAAVRHADSLGGVSVLVNNAGAIQLTQTINGEMDKWRHMFELNVFSLGPLLREGVKSMKNHKIDGHIINVSSISAHGLPMDGGKHIYNATKHAVRVITEGVRAELTAIGSKIKITMISPGVVDTEIFEAGLNPIDVSKMRTLPMLKSEDIALACQHILSTPPNVQVPTYFLKFRLSYYLQ
ncbi:unnamed protein product [Nesidiocoris tenuis]|uniref:Dehydrogenase n=1 Tax=Nesidiocoris tenuis TaxID=355587 RepID=A0A6H5HI32_9HEMI|nr:unnamed protein product [Nesidiocoris tenuis]CAB0017779.1 unnamed protein product [Nesidiocoris tenuis]